MELLISCFWSKIRASSSRLYLKSPRRQHLTDTQLFHSMKSTHVFQSFWYGAALSPYEWLCLCSFVKRGIEFHLYSYDDDLVVPEGVLLKDAREIYPEDAVFFYQKGPGKGSVAAFANMFRYKLLYDRGGWWVDTDVLYTGESLPPESTYYGLERGSIVNCAIMRFEPGDLIMQKCMKRSENMGGNVFWGSGGPHLLTEVIKELGEMEKAAPPEYAYPIPWREVSAFYNPEQTAGINKQIQSRSIPFMHIWNEVLSRIGIQKNIAPPKGSYLAETATDLDYQWPCPDVSYRRKTIRRLSLNYEAFRELKHLKADNNSVRKTYASFRRMLGF